MPALTGLPADALVAHEDQLAGTRLVRVEDGSGDGARILEAWTPTGLQVDLLLDRALDVYGFRYRGQQLSWLGPSGLMPRHGYEPGGFGWLRTFHGGMVVTCGLEHFGAPATRSAAEYAPPDDRTVDVGEHGRISHQAASLVRAELEPGDDPALVVVGEVRQAALYAEQYVLRREYRIPLLRPVIELRDTVTNVGPLPTRHVIVYHMNWGYPLVDAPAILRTETAAGVEESVFGPLGAATPEKVERLDMARDRDGWAAASIVNPITGLAVQLAYDTATMPAFFTWKLARLRANVLGLNPASHWSPDDAAPLEPGASRVYRWRLEVVAG